MRPSDLNLPAKFETFNPGQEDAIFTLISCPKRFQLVTATTGWGKSLLAVAAAKMLGGRTFVATGKKALQDQYTRDFGGGVTDIRGRGNYTCEALMPGMELEEYGEQRVHTCEDGPCRFGVQCSLKSFGCGYFDAIRLAHDSNITIGNYGFWLSHGKYPGNVTVGQYDTLILDEGHTVLNHLTEFCKVNLNRRFILSSTGLELPDGGDDMCLWSTWAKVAAPLADKKYALLKSYVVDFREIKRIQNLCEDLKMLAEIDEKSLKWRKWIVEDTSENVSLKPAWPGPYAEKYLFRGVKKVIMMSATLTPDTATHLSLPHSSWEFVDLLGGYEHKRRPFIFVSSRPHIRVDGKTTEENFRAIVSRMDEAIDLRLDVKGIIPCGSYTRATEIRLNTRHVDKMIFHDKGKPKGSTTSFAEEAIKEFKSATAPCYLVSPSIVEGHDFPYDDARLILLPKVPLVSPKDKTIAQRMLSDKGYSAYVSALAIQQVSGRCMRQSDDWCEILLFDAHWVWFKRTVESKGYFAKWFLRSCVSQSGVGRSKFIKSLV